MPETGNLYEIMGLPRYAPIDEVRATFRRLAVRYHPDKNPGDAEAEERFKQIAGAYDVLGDETKKREYDLRLTGFYTYQKTEGEEAKKKRQREEILERVKQKREREAREIRDAYAKSKRFMAYKWRCCIAAFSMLGALFLIVNNWYLYDVIGERGYSFFKMFAGYCITLATVLFFLSSLFKRWNAKNLDKPFSFDIRVRISTFFILYLGLIFSFSFTAPELFKKYQLEAFGETTVGVVASGDGPDLMLMYRANGKEIVKILYIPRPYIGFTTTVTVKYSSLRPYISEIVEVTPYEEL